MIDGTRLSDLLADRILILDGAMGTMLQRHAAADCDALTLTDPASVRSVHHAYLEAGADIIETNTFNSNAVSQAGSGMAPGVYELNVAAARLARSAADAWTARSPAQPRFVAGAIGPTSCALSTGPGQSPPAVSVGAMRDAYRVQVRGLIDGGVDLLLVETIFDTLNARTAIAAIHDELEGRGRAVPLLIAVTLPDRHGRTSCGETLVAFYRSIQRCRPLAVGLNCGAGAWAMAPHLAELSPVAGCAVACYPSAGLPNAFGSYDERPRDTAAALREFAEAGLVNVVGGCCGTTPEHIRAIADAMRGVPPRKWSG